MGTQQGANVNALKVTKETGPIFQENWFDENAQRAMASLAASILHLPGDYIEIGSWEGRSTIALANAVKPQPVYAVDTWQGNLNEDEEIKERAKRGEISPESRHPTIVEVEIHGRDVYQRFIENIEVATDGNIIPCRVGWREFMEGRDTPIKFVFLDADHTYIETRDTILAVQQHLVSGGIICGDDYGTPGVNQAVQELCPGHGWNHLWYWQKP